MCRTQRCIYLSPDRLATNNRLHVYVPEVEMVNTRELTEGIDWYVVKLFECGVLDDDVTADNNAQLIYVETCTSTLSFVISH
jgi:hypothetical protein